MRLLEIHAREEYGLPPEWCLYKYDSGKADSHNIIVVAGAVAPRKKNGGHNWKKKNPATDLTITFKANDHRAWIDAWETRTGTCRDCLGEEKKVVGWHHITGTRFAPCDRCGATGKFAANEKPADQ